jgi:zinc-ribbon domain
MIVCPNCRNANDEGAAFCSRCGASLDPGPAALMPRRDKADSPQIEIPPPPQPSRWRAIVVLGIAGALLIGAGAYLLFRPNPCRGTNFTSTRFGYCLEVPAGWTAEPAVFGGTATLDQFTPPSNSATVLVEAHDLSTGATLTDWAGFVRQREQDAGLIPGPVSDLSIDGTKAEEWDVSATSDGGVAYTMRDVVVVRNDVGWRVTLNGAKSTFAQQSSRFQGMLRSWRFR